MLFQGIKIVSRGLCCFLGLLFQLRQLLIHLLQFCKSVVGYSQLHRPVNALIVIITFTELTELAVAQRVARVKRLAERICWLLTFSVLWLEKSDWSFGVLSFVFHGGLTFTLPHTVVLHQRQMVISCSAASDSLIKRDSVCIHVCVVALVILSSFSEVWRLLEWALQ